MGVFLGWMPDAATQAALAALQREWQALLPDGAPRHAWRRPAQWHMTLRYLGTSVTDAQRVAIDHAMLALADDLSAPSGRLDGAQYWPDANVLVARIVPSDALTQWLKRIEAAMQDCGFAEARAQTPHITLARLRRGTRPPTMASSLTSPPVGLRIERINLLRTVPRGYASLGSWRLAVDRTHA